MKLDNIKHGVQRLNSLVDGWQTNGEIPRIERDMALDELRRLYDQLLDIEGTIASHTDVTAPAAVVAPVAAEVAVDTAAEEPMADDAQVEEQMEEKREEPVAEPVAESQPAEEADDDVLDIDALLGLSSPVATVAAATVATTAAAAESVVAESVAEPKVEEVVAPEDEVASEDEVAPEVEPEVEPEVAPEPMSSNGSLFDMEDIPVAKSGGRKILSLYNTGAMAMASTAAAAESGASVEADVVEQPKRLIDVLGSEKRVLGDEIATDDMPTTPFNRITDLRKAIGINDKFLMIKDLFGGNAVQYEATIETLNEFDDIDDCMIYIAENFSWNPDSEGAKLLVSLIERKLA